MILTELEARERWCPMSRIPGANDAGAVAVVNRNEEGEPHGPCVGSSCMMWRWHFELRGAPTPRLIRTSQGYCGLAGRPTIGETR